MATQNSAEQAAGAYPIPDGPGEAWLLIDTVTGTVEQASPAAAALLGLDSSARVTGPWQDLLAAGAQPDTALLAMISAAVRSTLPPVLVRCPDGREFIAGGQLIPLGPDRAHGMTLVLRQLHDELESELVADLSASDTIVILGVDPVLDRGGDIARMMMDIRTSLLDIVRNEDTVGLPVGTTISLVLRDIDLEGAQDISRALLSHLHSIPQTFGATGSDHQLSIGLARVSAHGNSLEALLAANRALLQAQHNSGLEPIVIARDSDATLIAARSINANGLFSDNRSAPQQRRFLALLLQLVDSHRDADTLPAAVIAHTLEQGGLLAMAIYQRRRDNVFNFVAGGARSEEGCEVLEERQLPRVFRDASRRMDSDYLEQHSAAVQEKSGLVVLPLSGRDNILGYLLLQVEGMGRPAFVPDVATLHTLAGALSALKGWRESPAAAMEKPAPRVTPMETGIEGYVGDNMEGAVDQAMFLAKLDVPIAIIGPRGTGKMYIARIIHQESGAETDMLQEIDCREFSSRKQADARISQELREGEGKTIVFKSPQLMNADAQVRLARQISTRTLADVSPPQYLPRVKLIALFPDDLEQLVRQQKLTPQLASAFAAYPITVPPIKDRKQAVLRWAHKILGQECALRERYVRGFTPDAEQAMLEHNWPGNISEMRQCIVDALDKTDKEWITPVDLGIFKGISADGAPVLTEAKPFLAMVEEQGGAAETYTPTAFEALDVALGEAVNSLLAMNTIKPLGTWLEDEIVLAVCERYGNDMRASAEFLHTKPRNISRWLPKIRAREDKRNSTALWQESRRLVREWIRESAQLAESPLQLAQAMLMAHVAKPGYSISVGERARIMGVSTPTYQKRLQEVTGG